MHISCLSAPLTIVHHQAQIVGVESWSAFVLLLEMRADVRSGVDYNCGIWTKDPWK